MLNSVLSKDGEISIGLSKMSDNPLRTPAQYPLYTIMLIAEGVGEYTADFGTFGFQGPSLIFATPLQTMSMHGPLKDVTLLQFHGDFYCIEYHKQEVACNGVLFNNIYADPTLALAAEEYGIFERIMQDLSDELSTPEPADAVVTAYLQLILAKATAIKHKANALTLSKRRDDLMEQLRALIEENFVALRKPAEYAQLLHISPDTLSKRCKQYFRKTPTELIHERVVLEAKKELHLTRKSIKEIAHGLKFEDEHYFSRFFKKVTKVSPMSFRQKTGISIVANLSSIKPD